MQLNLVDPAAAILPINRPVRIVTRNEETIIGRRLNEDTYTVQLIDSNERLRSLIKADLVTYEISEAPSKGRRTDSAEVADVIACCSRWMGRARDEYFEYGGSKLVKSALKGAWLSYWWGNPLFCQCSGPL